MHFFLLCAFCFCTTIHGQLLISGVISTSAGVRAVELNAVAAISALNQYSVRMVEGDTGVVKNSFSLPARTLSKGAFFFAAQQSSPFSSWFGTSPGTTSTLLNISGNDCVELLLAAVVVDRFGDPTVNGAGQPWEYTNGWAYRTSGTAASPAFAAADWRFSGPGALAGPASNAAAGKPFPTQSFSPAAGAWPYSPPTFGAVNHYIIGRWPLDGNFSDVSRSSFSATVVGNPTFTTGKAGQAATFTGAEYVQVGTSSAFAAKAANWTLAAWFRRDVPPVAEERIITVRSGNNSWASVGVTADVPARLACWWMQQGYGRQKVLTAVANYTDSQWHHAACTFEALTGVRLYLDGLQVASTKPTALLAAATSDPIQIAASRGEVGQNLWVGSLDAITAWNYSLSPTEVLHTYQGYAFMSSAVDCPANCTAGNVSVCDLQLFDEFGAQLSGDANCSLRFCPFLDGDGVTPVASQWVTEAAPGLYQLSFAPQRAGGGSFVVQWDGIPVATKPFVVVPGAVDAMQTGVSCTTIPEGRFVCYTSLSDQFGNFIQNCTEDFDMASTSCV
eukprot:EG_transcript_7962